VRTGVTMVLPRGRDGLDDPVYAGWHTLNGNGEMTGTTWVEESGMLAGPVAITNTHSVGVVRDAIIGALVKRDTAGELVFSLPVVAETFDGFLSDINGFHVKPEHARRALEQAAGGPVQEGNVGGGTGMMCHLFKGGIGTSSRRLREQQGGWTVGVLVQCNYGGRREFNVLGVPVGQEIPSPMPCFPAGQVVHQPILRGLPTCGEQKQGMAEPLPMEGTGSIIVVVATDAPLLPHQLKKLAKRVSLGVGRMGGLGENSSGDIFIAFSTMPLPAPDSVTHARAVRTLDDDWLNPLYQATVRATEEAIVNAMLAAEDMKGADNLLVPALPAERLVAALRKYGRMP